MIIINGELIRGRTGLFEKPAHPGEPIDRLQQPDEREMSLLCLRILRAALVYVNTLMLQDILADLDWEDVLTTEDVRVLSRCGRRTKPDRMAGQVHSLTGDANRYNGSRRTRHVDYVMVRS